MIKEHVTSEGNGQPPAHDFLDALFAPGEYVLCRPIETWRDEKGQKRSRVDHKGFRYFLSGSKNGEGEWGPSSDWPARLARVEERAAKLRSNIFFGVCPRFKPGGKYDLAWQIRTVRTLWADVDDCSVDESLKRCEQAGIPWPSIAVNSGHGTHLYWFLDKPFSIDDAGGDPLPVHTDWVDGLNGKRKPHRYLIDPATKEKLSLDARQNVPDLSPKAVLVQDTLAGIAAKIGGDHTTDLSRLLRMPETLNRKNERNGQEPKLCTLVEFDPSRRYPIEQFAPHIDAAPAKVQREHLAAVKLPVKRKLSVRRQDRFNELVTACAVAAIGDRSESDFALIAFAIETGQSAETVWPHVGDVGKFKEGGRRYFERTWESAACHTREKIVEKATRKASKPTSKVHGEEGLPRILVDVDESRVVNEAIAALAKQPNIYQRGGVLVHVVRNQPPPRGVSRPQDAPRIAPIRFPRLQELMATAASWEKPAGEGETELCHPPGWAVKAVDARGEWQGIRRLDAVVESPILRSDGSVLQTAGYDSETALIFAPQVDFPEVPEKPSRADVRRALDALLAVVEDFPFGADAHRSAWLSGVLTPFSRWAYHGPAPLHLTDGNVRGCGKSLLTDVTGIITAGRAMARMTQPRDEDEFRKRITSLAMAGEPLILIDNVNGALGGSSLDAALTATTWSDRILGRSEMASNVPLFATWYATGNNVVLPTRPGGRYTCD